MKENLFKILVKLKIYPLVGTIKALRVLGLDFGLFLSMFKYQSVDKVGNPIPWYTYPAIHYLSNLDLSKKDVFEWGSGNSTVFWSKRAKSVIAIESNPGWYKTVALKTKSRKNIKLEFAPKKKDYVSSIIKFGKTYDIIAIDGGFRFECAKIAYKYLKSGGLIILDNSNWFPKTSGFLKKNGFTEIPMAGFAPMIPYTSVTSFFLSKNSKLQTVDKRGVVFPGTISQKLD